MPDFPRPIVAKNSKMDRLNDYVVDRIIKTNKKLSKKQKKRNN